MIRAINREDSSPRVMLACTQMYVHQQHFGFLKFVLYHLSCLILMTVLLHDALGKMVSENDAAGKVASGLS